MSNSHEEVLKKFLYKGIFFAGVGLITYLKLLDPQSAIALIGMALAYNEWKTYKALKKQQEEIAKLKQKLGI
jgi:hypothetical protein